MTERREEAQRRDKQQKRCIKTANYVDANTVDVETEDDNKDINDDRVAGGGAAA
jgi:hypothetical protein